tara:strand:+ start:1251 stop:1547 length:297 start_codon:yes stop_codon:yes gene_type:complete
MKLTPKEIKEQKALYGSEAVNFFVRFFDMKERLKTLPEYFIKEVIKNSDDIRVNFNTRKGSDRAYKRKIKNILANRESQISSRKKDRTSMGKRTNKEV